TLRVFHIAHRLRRLNILFILIRRRGVGRLWKTRRVFQAGWATAPRQMFGRRTMFSAQLSTRRQPFHARPRGPSPDAPGPLDARLRRRYFAYELFRNRGKTMAKELRFDGKGAIVTGAGGGPRRPPAPLPPS